MVVPVDLDRSTGNVIMSDDDAKTSICGRRVLVIDSLIHSGGTMAAVVSAVNRLGPEAVYSYGFVLKRGSSFIPSYWSIMIDDHDRALLLLDELPNNRLNEEIPHIHLRKLAEADLQRAKIECDLESLNRITWGDRYFDMKSSESGRCTYVLELGEVLIGYITISFRSNRRLMIDEVVVAPKHKKHGHGGAMLRWSETIARHARCTAVDLWAIKALVGMYQRFSYEQRNGRTIKADDEEYVFMSYSLTPEQFDDLYV